MDAGGQRLSSAADGVAVLDGFGKLVRYDGAAAKLLGLPSSAVWRSLAPDEHFESPAVAVLTALAQSQRRSSKPPTITRRKITLPRAEPLQVELILTQVKDAEGVLAGTVVTIHPAEGPSTGERGGPRNRWQMLYMLSNATNGLTDLKEALTALLRASSQVLPVDSAALFACENDDSELRIIASLNLPADIHERISFRVGEGIVGWVIAEHQAVIIPNVLEDARYRPSLPGRWEGARSLLVVPIIVRGRALAALNLTRYRPDAFSNEDLKWAQLVSSQAARLLTRFRERLLPPSTRSAEMAHLLRPFVQALWASANFLTQYIGLLAKQGDLTPTSVELTQAASLQTKRLETLATDALDLVGLLRQPSALKKRPTDINRLIEEWLAKEGVPADPRTRTQLAPDLPLVSLEQQHISRALSYVLNQARASATAGASITVTTAQQGKMVEIIVSVQEMAAPKGGREQEVSRPTMPPERALDALMAHSIMEAHRGYLTILAEPFRAILTLPKARKSEDEDR